MGPPAGVADSVARSRASLGDLVATGMSLLSRNRRVGERLGRGKPLPEIPAPMRMVAEGVDTARTTMPLAARDRVDTPIGREVERVAAGGQRAADAYRALQPAGHGFDPD